MANWYVSTGGNNANAGTGPANGQAFQTVNRGAQAASAGDTIFILAGVYNESLEWFGWPGGTLPNNWANAITFAAYQQGNVVIRGTNPEYIMVMRGSVSGASNAPRYIIFDGITFDGQNVTGNYGIGIRAWDNTTNPANAPSHHIQLIRCRITDVPAGQGILMTWGSVGCRITNTEIDHINGPTNIPNNTQGIYGAADDLIVEGCHIHHCWGYGISNVSSVPNQDNSDHIIRNNIIHDCGQGRSDLGGINLGEGTGNLIYNNVVYNCAGPGIILGWGGGSNGSKIYNNTVYNCGGVGIQINSGDANAVVRNNIMYACNGGPFASANGTTTQDHNIFSNPSFVNIAAGNFRLSPASTLCIDTGLTLAEVTTDIDGGMRPAGSAYDIGAYEFGAVPSGGSEDPYIPVAVGQIVVRDSYSGLADTPLEQHVGEIGATITKVFGDVRLTGGTGRARPYEQPTGGGSGLYSYSGIPSSNEYDVIGSFTVESDLSGEVHYASIDARFSASDTSLTAEYSSSANTIGLYLSNGGAAQLLKSSAEVWGVGYHSIRLKVRASEIAVEVDGIQRLYSQDTSLLQVGRAAIRFYSHPSNATSLTPFSGIQIDELIVQNATTSGGVTLSGVSASSSAGAIGKAITTGINGGLGTSAIGSMTKTKTLSVIGIAASTVLGIFPGYVAPAPAVSSDVVVGIVLPVRVHTLSGFTNSASLGAVNVLQLGEVTLSGVAATGEVQTLPFSKVAALTSVSATASRGVVTPLRDSASLTGASATGLLGLVFTPSAVTLALSSVSAIGRAEYVIPPATLVNPDTGELVVADFFTIAGQRQQVLAGWTIIDAANNTGSMRFQIASPDGTYYPHIGEEVIYAENAIRIFGGYISNVLTSGAGGEGGTALVHDVTALDYNALASRRYWHIIMPAFSLRETLSRLSAFIPEVEMDPFQVDGPMLEEVNYKGWKISAILNELTVRTSYLWEIDYYKTLRMYTPGTLTAPFSITSGNGKAKLDISVEPDMSQFANHIIVYGTTTTGEATNLPSISLNGRYEALYSVLDTEGDNPIHYDEAALDAIAETILAATLPVLRTVRYNTLETGLHAGQSQFIDLPNRGITNTFVITEVAARYVRNLVAGRSVTAIEGLVYKNSWREVVKTWGGQQGGAVFGGASGGGGGVTPSNAVRTLVPLGGSGVDANASPSAGVWVPVAGGGQAIGLSAVQPAINTVPRQGTDAIITARVKVLEAGNTVQLRLYDVTVAAACPGLSLVVSSTDWTTAVWGIQLTPGSHYYELQMLTSVVGSPALAVAYLE